jgi:PAS domain S-box-containing protein
VVVFSRDITEQEETERALRESEELLQVTLRHAPIAVWEQDAQLRYSWIYNSQLGYRDEQVRGLRDVDLMERREDAEAIEALKRAVLETGTRRREEVVVTRGGGRHMYDLNIEPVFESGGRTVGIKCVAYEITQRREAELELEQAMGRLAKLNETLEARVVERTRALQESEERYRALVEASAQIVWSADAQGRATGDSQSWRAFTGQSEEEARGWGWLDAVHGEDQVTAASAWASCVENLTPLDAEFRLRHVSGDCRWVRVRAVPLQDEAGAVRGWVGMCIDITKQKRVERENRTLASRLALAEQEERRRIGELLHNDIQQMLIALQMQLTMLRPTGAADLDAQIMELEKFSEQIVETTRSLSAQLVAPALGTEALADAMEWLARWVEEQYRLQVRVEADRPCTVRDHSIRELVLQSAREILFNVVKHAGVEEAWLKLRDMGDKVMVSVVDQGRGFDVEAAMQAAERETSIGLFSVRERLGLFGGQFEIRSQPGAGTHVTIVLPKARE